MKTSRQRLLDYLENRGAVTVSELSRALRMTPANARHHLNILTEQGVVAVIGQRAAPGRGRPALIYGLSESLAGHNLDGLAGVLLQLLQRLTAEEGAPAWPAQAAALLADQIDIDADAALSRRLVLAMQGLNQMAYQARWEARPGAPRVIFQRCPYAAIIADFPELCVLDSQLLAHMLNLEAVQESKLAPDGRGGKYCIFQLRLPRS
ncbi:MAG TPA: helix-turn-helix domain-containing protein [Anaerolineales bacterium]|nr:helix-turn-helix domain-containing protein [Anaerolineales bacterium]